MDKTLNKDWQPGLYREDCIIWCSFVFNWVDYILQLSGCIGQNMLALVTVLGTLLGLTKTLRSRSEISIQYGGFV